jgi:signal transduction histidine kinase
MMMPPKFWRLMTKYDFHDFYQSNKNYLFFVKTMFSYMLTILQKWLFALFLGLALASLGRVTEAAEPTSLPTPKLTMSLYAWTDPTGSATIETVAAMPLTAMRPQLTNLSLGFTNDVVWLKVNLKREHMTDSRDWYLVLGQTVFSDVRLYKPDGKRGFSEHFGTPGPSQPAREVNHRQPVFLLNQADLSETSYWLRIQSPTALNTHLRVVQREVFLKESSQEGFFWGILFGGYLIVIVFYVVFWTWTREDIHKKYIAYITVNFLAALFTEGWPAQFSETTSNQTWIVLLGLLIATSITTGIRFSMGFIELQKNNPQLDGVLQWTSYAVTLWGMSLILRGHYNWVMPYLQTYSMLMISTLIVIGLFRSSKGDGKSRFFLFAFSFFYLGVVGRYLRNIGIIEPNFWNANSYQFGAFIHMLVMSIGIFASYNKLRKDKENAELRADAEARLRDVQSDFLSLVSHEFRTPLTISSASAENLLQQPELNQPAKLRVEKILRANQRMISLMETYLSTERMKMSTQVLNIQNHELGPLCRLAMADVADTEKSEIQLNCPKNIWVTCDADLIRIALSNLLQNARKYSPTPGSVSIRCWSEPKSIYINVTDQGPGIPESEIKLIFTRYFRGKNALNQPGAGLGLHIVQTIVLRHGGSITVRNLPDSGCEFCMVLPR